MCREFDKVQKSYIQVVCNEFDFVLRLTNKKHRSKAQIDSELDFQRYLFENGANVAKPLRTIRGESCLSIELNSEEYFVSAIMFADGKDWDERTDNSPEVFFNIGKAIGRIHSLSKKYSAEGKLKRRVWYEQQELVAAPELFKNYDARLYHNFVESMKQMKNESVINNDTFGLTHGDYLMSNYLIDNDKVTVIDFDECEYSWYAMDLAICIRCYLTGAEPERVYTKRDFAELIHYNLLSGYKTENAITDDMIFELNRYIKIRDYIELSQLLNRIKQGHNLCDVENRLLSVDLDRVLNNKPFLDFKLGRIETLKNDI